MRKFVCAAVVTVCAVSIALADEFGARIMDIKDGKVTFKKTEKGKVVGEEMTLPLTKDATFAKGKISKGDDGKVKIEAGDALDKAAVTALMAKAQESKAKSAGAGITTDADNKKITKILFIGGKTKDKGGN